jgi:hypothetical protein
MATITRKQVRRKRETYLPDEIRTIRFENLVFANLPMPTYKTSKESQRIFELREHGYYVCTENLG